MAQASASKIRRRVREREGVARFISDVGAIIHANGMRATPGQRGLAAMLCEPAASVTFDVLAVREAAEALVRLEAEQTVFEDWTRERGLGPENREPGAFIEHSNAWIHVGPTLLPPGKPKRGGWPGNLAREYAWKRCPNACEVRVVTFGLGPERDTRARCRVRPDGKICDCTDGRVRHQGRDPRAPMGRALARLGQRVLAAIDGQPSECRGHRPGDDDLAIGDGRMLHYDMYVAVEPFHLIGGNGEEPRPCPDCRGTGHNLRGALPAVEWPVAQRARDSDGAHAAWNEGTGDPRIEGPTTVSDPVQAMVLGHDRRRHPPSPSFATKTTDGVIHHRSDTRVVPRGTHRNLAPDRWGRHVGAPWALMPRWRRGELRHAERQVKRRRAIETREAADDDEIAGMAGLATREAAE